MRLRRKVYVSDPWLSTGSCYRCLGDGVVFPFRMSPKRIPCPDCRGTGRVPVFVYRDRVIQ